MAKSDWVLEDQTAYLYSTLDSRLKDTHAMKQAIIWQPKAMMIKKISDSAYNYIQALETKLKIRASVKTDNGSSAYALDGKDPVIGIFNTDGKGVELYKQLTQYNIDILNVDSMLTNLFKNTIIDVSLAQNFDKTETEEDFTHEYFSNTTTIEALGLLHYYQNQVRVLENKMVTICVTQTDYRGDKL
jgi:hypothetical protein